MQERLGNLVGAANSHHQLGLLAYFRGDHPEAERLYRKSLDMKERLGDQAGAANGYHQLGVLAQDRGDYPEAERLYRKSLDVFERLGNQAGAAGATSQLGSLRSAQRRYSDAVQLHVTALITWQKLQVPDARIDLTALQALRNQLSTDQFESAVLRVVDRDTWDAVRVLLGREVDPNGSG